MTRVSYIPPAGVDAKSGAIFCRECDDFVYNGNILDAFTQASLNVEERSTGFEGEGVNRIFSEYMLSDIWEISSKEGKRALQTMGTYSEGHGCPCGS